MVRFFHWHGKVDVGESFVCGIDDTQSVHCWGYNQYGQTQSPNGAFVSVSTGNSHACGLTSTGSVECWDVITGVYQPLQVVYPQISAGDDATCGITSNGVFNAGVAMLIIKELLRVVLQMLVVVLTLVVRYFGKSSMLGRAQLLW